MDARLFSVVSALAIAFQAPGLAAERQHGVALYEVDAEAGLQPDAPKPDDIKMPSLEGHAYWLRPTPVFSGGVAGARIEEKCDRAQIWLRLDQPSKVALHNYAISHFEPVLAIVLDGQVIDPVARLMSGWYGAEVPVLEMDRAIAQGMLNRFQRDKKSPLAE